MKFVTSGWVSEEVLKDFTRISNCFAEEMQVRLEALELAGPATGVLWLPSLTGPEFPVVPEKSVYRKSERSLRLNKTLNHERWTSGDDAFRTKLYAGAFIEALEGVAPRSLPSSDKEKLSGAALDVVPVVINRLAGRRSS